MSEQGNELQRSFNRYLRRNQAWVFIILTGIILFVSVFVYRSFAKSTKTPLDNYKRSDYTNARTNRCARNTHPAIGRANQKIARRIK